MNLFFHGVWRMDWGFGNPNMTAAFIVTILVLAWLPAYLWKQGFWWSLLSSIPLGICLIHTLSRGGLLGGAAGLGALLFFAPRPWLRPRMITGAIAFWIVIFGSVFLNTQERFTQGIVQEDKSITHRLQIWKKAPEMLAANPTGWGWNQSGQAYMTWFEPLNRAETYGSLVNTHLSKVVELGVLGGALYLFLWILVLLLSWPGANKGWKAIPFALLLGFGVTATFSNMAGKPTLWILPALCVIAVSADAFIKKSFPRRSHLLAAAIITCVSVGALYFYGQTKHPLIKVYKGVVYLGGGRPEFWIVLNEQKMTPQYGKDLRGFIARHPGRVCGIIQSLQALPKSVKQPVLVMSETTAEERKSLRGREIAYLEFINPQFSPLDLPKNLTKKAVMGEYSQSPYAADWNDQKLSRKISGAGDFIPNWIQNILEPFLKDSFQ